MAVPKSWSGTFPIGTRPVRSQKRCRKRLPAVVILRVDAHRLASHPNEARGLRALIYILTYGQPRHEGDGWSQEDT